MSKILLIHDTFLMKGGAERMNIEIAKILDADIATAVWSADCYDPRSMDYHGKIYQIGKGWRRGMIGFVRMKWDFFRAGKYPLREIRFASKSSKSLPKNLSDYDAIIFSNEAISAVWNTPKSVKTYYYAHSISRHLFDLQDEYLQKVPPILRPVFVIFAVFLRWLYRHEIQKIDTIFTNSPKNVSRIVEWLGRDDAIYIAPPVDTEFFSSRNFCKKSSEKIRFPSDNDEYFLSFSRLTHPKRIDTIIEVFKNLREKNLLILYGDADSQKCEFMQLAGFDIANIRKGEIQCSSEYPNIAFCSLLDNNELPRYIASALASICISKNEDFGMVAIESLACGTPVIAAREGGYLETIRDDVNGILISTDSLEIGLYETLSETPDDTWKILGKNARKSIKKYDLAHFREKITRFFDPFLQKAKKSI